ncbi:glycoside hydrolase family 30 beta sandwich domain-containing protein [Marinagarivorans cellulosilyticus]|uniref:glycoside hydrolase family 30 beta sandwich domain-containing protein n=1 Tax=Marinagarivorans cellulosilyticus TaxID=2721545 RepID=UPI003B835CBF
MIAQAAKFVDANAQRIASSSDNSNLHHVAFQNPDNSRVLLVYNPLSDEQSFWVNGQTQQFEYTLPGRSAVTFDWE